MERFTLNRNDLCLCGSGKKYKHCCLNFIDLTLKDYYAGLDKCNYELAYNAINSELTKYLVKVKRHIILVIEEKKINFSPLLKIDIEAVGEIIDHLLFLLNKEGVNVDFVSKVSFISSILKEKLWHERMKSFIVIYYYIINYNEKSLNKEVENIKIDEIEDIELIKLILDIKKSELGIGQQLALLDKIINSEKDDIIKAKYQFEKALVFLFNSDKESAMKLATEVIQLLSTYSLETMYQMHISAQMFCFFAQITSDKLYFYKAIDLYLKMNDDNDFTDTGKAENLIALGYTYYLLKDYENAIKCLCESKRYKYLYLADIYMALINIEIEDYRSAEKLLTKIVYDNLVEDKFDYLVVYALYILNAKDTSKIVDVSNYLKNVRIDNSSYYNNVKMNLLMELQELSFRDSIKDETVRLKWLDKLNKNIMLQPNFFGIGINVNNIIDGFNKK